MSETEGLCEDGSLSRQSVDIGRIGRIDYLAIGVILFNHENDVIWSGKRRGVVAMREFNREYADTHRQRHSDRSDNEFPQHTVNV